MIESTDKPHFGGSGSNPPHPAFICHGLPSVAGPVVIAVPHAGRDYPPDVIAQARGGRAALEALEDRHADLLAQVAIRHGHCALVARTARAVIDLNRHVDEIDPASVADIPYGVPIRATAKLRGGLGLIPARAQGLAELWRQRPTYADVRGRIEAVYLPWHRAIADALAVSKAAHGTAVLVDLHSMPSLKPVDGRPLPQIVLGDRFGQSASGPITAIAEATARATGLQVAVNAPYAGGYALERHGDPVRGIHALQVEIDRALYLDDDLRSPGPGVARLAAFIHGLVEALGEAVGAGRYPLAAE